MSLQDWGVLTGLCTAGGSLWFFGIIRPLIRRPEDTTP